MDMVMMSNLGLNINYPLGDFQQNGTCNDVLCEKQIQTTKKYPVFVLLLTDIDYCFFLLSSPIMINQSTLTFLPLGHRVFKGGILQVCIDGILRFFTTLYFKSVCTICLATT